MSKGTTNCFYSSIKQIMEDLFLQFLRDSESLLSQMKSQLSLLNGTLDDDISEIDFSFVSSSFENLNRKFISIQKGEYRLESNSSLRPNVPSATSNPNKKTFEQIKLNFGVEDFKVDLQKLKENLRKPISVEEKDKTEDTKETEQNESEEAAAEAKEKERADKDSDPVQPKNSKFSFKKWFGFGSKNAKKGPIYVDLKEDETKAYYDPAKKKWCFEGEEDEEEEVPLPPPKMSETKAAPKPKIEVTESG